MAQQICRVCQKNFSKYTCPRCNLQYCCLDCYKKHGDRCTEGFYKEHVSEELRQTRASEQEKRHMLEILQRVHDSDTAGLPVSEDLPEGHAEAPTAQDASLSEQTIARLLERAEDGRDLRVALEDLAPEERAAFEAELASGALARLVLPWEPWWRSAEAQRLSLSGAGTRLIQERGSESSDHDGELREPSAVPGPPERALPRLGALSRAAPSPLLQWQLVEILYAYCTAMHLYQGEWASDAMGAALAASAASLALEGSAAGPPPEPPASAMLALTECIARACMPALHGPGGRQFAVAIVEDVKVLIGCGRPAVVCALTDLHRLFTAAAGEAKGPKQADSQSRQLHSQGKGAAKPLHPSSPMTQGQDKARENPSAAVRQQQQLQHPEGGTDHADSVKGSSGPGESHARTASASGRASNRRRLRQQLQAAERRLAYFQSWTNEQAQGQYQHILEAVAEASQVFEQAQDRPHAPRGELADMANGHTPVTGKDNGKQVSGQPVLPRPALQEVDGLESGSDDADTSRAGRIGLQNESPAREHADAGTQYDTLD